MERLDNESKQFIKFALDKMEDNLFAKSLGIRIIYKFIRFYNSPNFDKLLKEKLIRGGIEHGKPSYNKRQIEREVRDEMLDLAGWNLIKLWEEKKWKK